MKLLFIRVRNLIFCLKRLMNRNVGRFALKRRRRSLGKLRILCLRSARVSRKLNLWIFARSLVALRCAGTWNRLGIIRLVIRALSLTIRARRWISIFVKVILWKF